jgi:hypothetical protein
VLALRNSSEQDFALGDAGRSYLGMAGFQLGLDRVERIILDKTRDSQGKRESSLVNEGFGDLYVPPSWSLFRLRRQGPK